MKRLISLITVLILVMITVCGCDRVDPVPNEQAMVADLQKQGDLLFGGTVTEISIIKRLTDTENRTDTVYVVATLDNENHTRQESYVINYVLYNDGWLMETAELYSGNDAVTQVTPKYAPTDEEIMLHIQMESSQEIRFFQYTKMEEYGILYDTSSVGEEFFAEGLYDVEIAEGSLDGLRYETTVVTNRIFEYADVTETANVTLYFDYMYDNWLLSQYIVEDLEIDWNLEGSWQSPNYVLSVEISDVTHSTPDDNAQDNVTCYRDFFDLRWMDQEESVGVYRPSSQKLLASKTTLSRGTFDYSFFWVYVTPNGLFYYDEEMEEIVAMNHF